MQHDDQRDRCSNLVGFGSVDKIGTATSGAFVDKLLPGRIIRTRTVLKMCQESSNCQNDEQQKGDGPNSEMPSPVCQECWFQHAHSLFSLHARDAVLVTKNLPSRFSLSSLKTEGNRHFDHKFITFYLCGMLYIPHF